MEPVPHESENPQGSVSDGSERLHQYVKKNERLYADAFFEIVRNKQPTERHFLLGLALLFSTTITIVILARAAPEWMNTVLFMFIIFAVLGRNRD